MSEFANLSYTTAYPKYFGLPKQELIASNEAINKRYLTNLQGINTAKAVINNMDLHPTETHLKNQAVEKFEGAFNEIKESGRYDLADGVLTQAVGDLANNIELNSAEAKHKNYKIELAKLEKAYEDGVMDYQTYQLQLTDPNNQYKGLGNPDKNGYYDTSYSVDVIKTPKYHEALNSFLTNYHSNSNGKINYIKNSKGELVAYNKTTDKYVTKTEITKSLKSLTKSIGKDHLNYMSGRNIDTDKYVDDLIKPFVEKGAFTEHDETPMTPYNNDEKNNGDKKSSIYNRFGTNSSTQYVDRSAHSYSNATKEDVKEFNEKNGTNLTLDVIKNSIFNTSAVGIYRDIIKDRMKDFNEFMENKYHKAENFMQYALNPKDDYDRSIIAAIQSYGNTGIGKRYRPSETKIRKGNKDDVTTTTFNRNLDVDKNVYSLNFGSPNGEFGAWFYDPSTKSYENITDLYLQSANSQDRQSFYLASGLQNLKNKTPKDYSESTPQFEVELDGGEKAVFTYDDKSDNFYLKTNNNTYNIGNGNVFNVANKFFNIYN